jgi:WhiB family transcriptional regulator, redox-sensing transcriptional regulator
MSTLALRPPRWTERAVCVEVDPEIFHPGKGEPVEPARALCRSCEVRLDCLAYALRREETWGIWGGFSVEGRRSVRRQLRAGRSLAAIVASDDAAYYRRVEAQDGLGPHERRRAGERRRRAEKRSAIELAANRSQPRKEAA